MQGTAMIFGAQTSTYFLRLMTLYLSHSLLLGDTGEKETSLKNTRGHGGWIRINVQLMEIRFLITLKAMMTIPCSLKLCTVNVCPSKRPLQHHRPYVLVKKKQKETKWSPDFIWSNDDDSNNNNNICKDYHKFIFTFVLGCLMLPSCAIGKFDNSHFWSRD